MRCSRSAIRSGSISRSPPASSARSSADLPTERRPRDRQRDPDRRRHQSRQLGRAAARLGRPRDRGQHRDPLAVRHAVPASASPSRSTRSTAWCRRSSPSGYVPTPGIGIVTASEDWRHAPASKAWSSRGRFQARRPSAPACAGSTRQPQARRRDRRRERQDGPQAARPDRGAGARRRRQEGRATDQTRRPGGHDGCRGDGYRQAPLRRVAATCEINSSSSPAAFKALVMTAPTSTGKTGGVGISSGAG